MSSYKDLKFVRFVLSYEPLFLFSSKNYSHCIGSNNKLAGTSMADDGGTLSHI